MDEQLYGIQDGVRRSKAAWLCGQETIAAQVDGSRDVIHVSVAALRSPKTRNFFDSGIRALHKVIIGTRLLGCKNTDSQLIAKVLDHADALGFMLMADFRDFEGEEAPLLFRLHLQGIEDAFKGFDYFAASFDQNMKRGEAKPEQARELAAAGA